MDKIIHSPHDAVADIFEGARIGVGGFGVVGVPEFLLRALRETGVGKLTAVSNNAGVDGRGLGLLLQTRQVEKMIASYVGENKEFARQYLSGELTVELTPQGTLAEKLRAAGAGIPAFFTITGAGTQVEAGGIPLRYDDAGHVIEESAPKETRTFETFGEPKTYVLEESLPCDFSLVRAAKGDPHGNLVFHASAQNFNPPVAQAGRITIAEVEELVEVGQIRPEDVDLPGVYVHRVVPLTPEQVADKPIEKMTLSEEK